MREDSIQIPIQIWRKLQDELALRGDGKRESGAFLLGKIGTRNIVNFICYDDLDPTALESGIIVFQGACFVPLWNYCDQNKMMVLADVHTHGGDWTKQSGTDRTNPMIEATGHIALIIPNFAQNKSDSLSGVGIFEYRGNHRWKSWAPTLGKILLI